MEPLLLDMRQKRNELITNYLKEAQGNLSARQVHPARNFASLSAGEKRRMTCLLAFEHARTHPNLQLVIHDEPLAHLDQKSIQDQIEMIKKIQQLPHAPAQLIIAHHFVEELSEQLQETALINLS